MSRWVRGHVQYPRFLFTSNRTKHKGELRHAPREDAGDPANN